MVRRYKYRNNVYNSSLYYSNHCIVSLRYNSKTDNLGISSGFYFQKDSKERNKKLYLLSKQRMKNLKINGCAICGYNECNAALDFHHVNPKNKTFQMSLTNMSRNAEKVAVELNKCILLCANCHRKVHAEEGD